MNAALLAVQFSNYASDFAAIADKLADALEIQIARGHIVWTAVSIPGVPRTEEVARRRLRSYIGGEAIDALEAAAAKSLAAAA